MRTRWLTWAAIFFILAPGAWAIRAGLDFTFRVDDDGEVQEITCDFCGFDFRDRSGKIFTLSVSAARGYVDVFFMEHGTPEAANWGPLVHPQEPAVSSEDEFEVGYFRRARVREGQTLRLRGKPLAFTLVDAFGLGCPPGAQC